MFTIGASQRSNQCILFASSSLFVAPIILIQSKLYRIKIAANLLKSIGKGGCWNTEIRVKLALRRSVSYVSINYWKWNKNDLHETFIQSGAAVAVAAAFWVVFVFFFRIVADRMHICAWLCTIIRCCICNVTCHGSNRSTT